MEEIKVSEMLQADSIEKDNAVMIIQDGVNKKASGSIQTATGTSLSLTSVADTCKVTSNSKNMFDGQLELGTYSDAGVPSDSSTNYRNVNKIKVEPETTYTFSIDGVSQKYAVYYYNASGTFISAEGLTTGTFTTPANCYYINFRCFNADFTSDYANLKLQLEQGTATDYNPYNTKVGIAVKELQLEDGSIQGIDGQPISAENRRRSANFITIDATKQHIITTGSYQLSVYQYKADGTFLESSQGWQNSPYTLTPNAQTGKIKLVIPNSNAKVYDISIDDIKPQIITLTPDETKTAFTYDTKTIVESNGSVTIEYNAQARLLNNNDFEPVKEYVDKSVVNVDKAVDNDYKVNITHSDNLFTQNNLSNGYLDTSGNVVSNAGYKVSDYIDIHGVTSLEIRGTGGNNEITCFYDANTAFISAIQPKKNSSYICSVPNNAYYVRTTVPNSTAQLNNFTLKPVDSIVVNGTEIYKRTDIDEQFRLVTIVGSTGNSGTIEFTDAQAGSKAYVVIASKIAQDGTYCDLWFVRLGCTAITKLGGTGTGTATASLSNDTITITGLGTYSYVVVYQVMHKVL